MSSKGKRLRETRGTYQRCAKKGCKRKVERDRLERTIATVRNHRDADNCWPSWANIFADEIERLWRLEDALDAYWRGETEDVPRGY